MGAYFSMELNAMAAMLYGQRAEPWHASADIWGSASQQLLSTHGDLGAANSVIKTWPQSVGSVSQLAFSGQVIGSLASLAEWSAYTGAMSAALRLGGTAINAAQSFMPMLQSGYDTAMSLTAVPIIGPFAAQAALALHATGAGMMEAVGAVMQAPMVVPTPTQGWQGPGAGGASMPSSPVPAVPATSVLDAADKLVGLFEKGASLAQNVLGMAQSGSAGNLGDFELPSLAGDTSTGALALGSMLPGNAPTAGGVPGTLVAGAGALGALASAGVLRGGRGVEQLASGLLGTRIGAGSEPALAGSTAARAAASGLAAKATPTIAPPLGGGGGGGSANGTRPGGSGRSSRDGAGGEQEERLRRSGVQAGLQGRAAREPVDRFTLPPVRQRRVRGEAVLDEELFEPLTVTDPDSASSTGRHGN